MALTKSSLEKIVRIMREYEIPPRRVESEEMALEMTQNDPAGHEWFVGEEFYVLDGLSKPSSQ